MQAAPISAVNRPIDEALLLRRGMAAQARRRVDAGLRAADVRVKAHERIHAEIAGRYADSAPRYIYVAGPDGRPYAVGGSVSVDLHPIAGDPEATLRKAQALMRAAVGPGSPSAADMRIAAAAYRLAQTARREMAAERNAAPYVPGSLVNLLA